MNVNDIENEKNSSRIESIGSQYKYFRDESKELMRDHQRLKYILHACLISKKNFFFSSFFVSLFTNSKKILLEILKDI
jgi:hypothetical protein